MCEIQLQLPKMCELSCHHVPHTCGWCVTRTVKTDLGDVKYLFSTNLKLKFRVGGSVTWQLVTERDFSKYITWNSRVIGTLWMVCDSYRVRLIGRSICSIKVVKDSWDVHFPMLLLRAGLLILRWMASLASLANCLLS